MSWRGFDNSVYYMVDTEQYVQMLNYSGCGNTISGNHPVTKQMIIDSCRRYSLQATELTLVATTMRLIDRDSAFLSGNRLIA